MRSRPSVHDHWMMARLFTSFIISSASVCSKVLPVNLPLTCIFSFQSLPVASPTSSAWAWKTTLGGERGRTPFACSSRMARSLYDFQQCTVEAEWLCVSVGWGRTLHLCNGGAGALRCLPRVRNRAGNTQRGGGGEKREKSQEGKRDEGEGGVTTTDTHAHIQARNTVTPLPHHSHIHSIGKQQTLEKLVHTGLNGFR